MKSKLFEIDRNWRAGFDAWLSWLVLGLLSCYQVYMQFSWNRKSLFGLISDDAYISLVYANNLASGHGLVYNIGERVEGYTNFLWVLVMSIPFYLDLDPLLFIKVVACFSSIILIWLIYFLCRTYFSSFLSLLIAGGFAVSSHLAYMASWGLETVFFMMLYVGAIYSILSSRFLLAGVLFALAAMTRMEIVLVLAVFFLWILVLSYRAPIYSGLIKFSTSFGSLFGLYFIWRYSYYGYLLPNTYYAKVGGGEGSSEVLLRGWDYVVLNLERLGILEAIAISVLVAVPVWVFGGFYRKSFRIDDPAVPLVGSAFLYVLYIIGVGGDVFNERFLVQALPLLSIGAMMSYYRAICVLSLNHVLSRRFRAAVSALLPILFFIGLGTSKPSFPYSTHLTGWASLGMFLNKLSLSSENNPVLATDAAGAIKYYSQLRTIDILGLNDTHIARRKVRLGSGVPGHEKQDNTYVLNQKPTFISTWVDEDGGAGRGFDAWFEFRRNYEPFVLLDTSSTVLSQSRIIQANHYTRCELAELRRRDKRPVFDWGIWKRRAEAKYQVRLVGSDFFSSMPDILGKCERDFIAYLKDRNYRGAFLYGPYMVFPLGDFKVTFSGQLEKCRQDAIALVFDIYDGKQVLQIGSLAGREGVQKQPFVVSMYFSSTDKEKRIEFRAHSQGNCAVKLESVGVEPTESRSIFFGSSPDRAGRLPYEG